MRIVFMGSPDFAIPTLEALIMNHKVIAVITQTDKPSGRGKKMTAPAVKACAEQNGIPIYQFEKVNSDSAKQVLTDLKPDVIVVVAYGQILKPWLLNLPKYGCINVHASLLPRWRGASPIQTAIVSGDTQSGVSIMEMDTGLDTGDVYKKVTCAITTHMTGGDLHDQLMYDGANALIEVLQELENGTAKNTPQDHQYATYAPLLTKKMAQIDWSQPCKKIVDVVRGYTPWPVAHTYYDGKIFKVFGATQASNHVVQKNGAIVDISDEKIYIQATDGVIAIDDIQLAGAKRMSVKAFLLGRTVKIGTMLERK